MKENTMRNHSIAALLASTIAGTAAGQDLGIRPAPATPPALPIVTQVAGIKDVSVIAVPAAATTNPQAQALPIEQSWTLTAGKTIGQNLKTWADRANWTIVWQLPTDWVVPAQASFTGAFPDAATSVMETLAANGALVRAQIFEGNRTMVVSGPGNAQQ
jgi:hypothetical protein